MTTVTLVSRTRSGTDAYGNDTWTTTETAIGGCVVWPRTSSELVQGQDTVIVGLNLLAPAGTVIQPTDQVKVAGTLYEVDGQPGDWTNPFTSWDAGVQVALKTVSG